MTNVRELLALYHRDRGGSVSETEAGVRELSPMFNGVTPHKPGYLAAGRLRRAYTHYYLPVNAEKVSRVLDEVASYAPLPETMRVLDFGCGPGTASVALLLKRKVAQLTLVDVVDEAVDDAAWFCRQLGVEARRAQEPPAGEKYDLILAANVLSETEAPLEDLLTDFGHLVVVEPALRSSTRQLMEWRNRVAAKGWKIAAPCLRSSPCPMLEQKDLWCHMDIAWPRPGTVAEIDRRVGLTKESLKYSYMVVTKYGRTLTDLGGTHRVVTNLHKEKGKAWTMTCGREGPLCRTEVLTRHRSETTSAFFRAERGDVLKMEAAGDFARSEGPIERVR